MYMIELSPLANGAHRNQTIIHPLPDGWAVIPENMELPATFPFVGVEAADGIVTSLTADQAAWDAVQETQAPETPQPPTLEERVTALESENAALKEELQAAKILLGLEEQS